MSTAPTPPAEPTMAAAAIARPLTPSNSPSNVAKKVKRKASKPILTWLQRKLAGRRHITPPPPVPTLPSTRSRANPPPLVLRTLTIPPHQPSNTIILNEDDASSRVTRRSSSSWAPSNPVEADDDASIRPLPPTSPPSPAPSRSSSSYLSDPRTFRSGAASTKPTTLLSIESANGIMGMAHIAQAPQPSTPGIISSSSPLARHPTAGFSRLPVPVQAPLHTSHHPRNNPHPSSPPPDNASILTLASSAFASTHRWAADDASQYQGHESVLLGVADEDEAETWASVRALRPRSSRRGSFESARSAESRWSGKAPSSSQVGLGRAGSLVSHQHQPSVSGSAMGPGLFVQDEERTPPLAADKELPGGEVIVTPPSDVDVSKVKNVTPPATAIPPETPQTAVPIESNTTSAAIDENTKDSASLK